MEHVFYIICWDDAVIQIMRQMWIRNGSKTMSHEYLEVPRRNA